jgi:glycerol-3-phosphate acyltransferase PlsY
VIWDSLVVWDVGARDVGVWVAGYLLGCLPVAQLVAGRFGVDPTAAGSGNPGASNVYRTAGRRAGAAVLLGDMAKGAAAAGLGLAAGDRLLGLAAGVAAVVGHVAPATRRFRGGKGVATAAGTITVLFPLTALAAMGIWSVVIALTSLASLASLAAVAVTLAGLVATGVPGVELALAGAMLAVVLVRHTGNIGRLIRGAERTVRRDFPSSNRSWKPIPMGQRPPRPGADHR